MDTFVSQLATAFVIAMVPVVVGALGYVAKSVVAYLKARATAEQLKILQQLASAAVSAVEQTLASKKGQEKKDAALAIVRSTLLSRGITLDESAIEAAIESAVYQELGVKIELPANFGSGVIDALPEAGDADATETPADGPIVA